MGLTPAKQRAYRQRLRGEIQKHGWIVQSIFDPEGGHPFQYTIGLTAAGLPELALDLPGRQSEGWFQFGQGLLNQFAKQSLAKELQVGQTYPSEISSGIVVEVAALEVPEKDTLYPGFAIDLYGRECIRLLELKPQGW